MLPDLQKDTRRAAQQTLSRLVNRSPITQIVFGSIFCVVGTFLTIGLLGAGVLLGLTLVGAVGGFLLLCNGIGAIRRRKELERQGSLVWERGEELIAMAIEAKRSGGSAVRVLRDEGITDIQIRQKLLREADLRIMEERERAAAK